MAYNQTVWLSPNGVTWYRGFAPFPFSGGGTLLLDNVGWDAGTSKFFALQAQSSSSPQGLYSSDGVNWTAATIPTVLHTAIGGTSNVFWASDGASLDAWFLATAGSQPAASLYTSDDITWTRSALGGTHSVNAITWDGDNSRFLLAVNTPALFTSTDGNNWTSLATSGLNANGLGCMGWFPGIILAWAVFGTTGVQYSTNGGANWSNAIFGSAFSPFQFAYNGLVYVAATSTTSAIGNGIALSATGTAGWAAAATAVPTCNSVTYSPGLGIFVAHAGNQIWTSANGNTWTQQTGWPGGSPTTINNGTFSVQWSAGLGLFVATGNVVYPTSPPPYPPTGRYHIGTIGFGN